MYENIFTPNLQMFKTTSITPSLSITQMVHSELNIPSPDEWKNEMGSINIMEYYLAIKTNIHTTILRHFEKEK
jgi:hypothetical protein